MLVILKIISNSVRSVSAMIKIDPMDFRLFLKTKNTQLKKS